MIFAFLALVAARQPIPQLTYPTPPIERRGHLQVALGKGASARLVFGGRVEGGRVICWDTGGRIDPEWSKIMTRRMSDEIKYLGYTYPAAPSDRVAGYIVKGDPWVERFERSLAAGQRSAAFFGFLKHGADYVCVQLAHYGPASNQLEAVIDEHLEVPSPAIPLQPGSTARIGRGAIRIGRIQDLPDGEMKVFVTARGDTYDSIMLLPADHRGALLPPADRSGKPVDAEPKVRGVKYLTDLRNGTGSGVNTLDMNPAVICYDHRFVPKVIVETCPVRRYVLDGIPYDPKP